MMPKYEAFKFECQHCGTVHLIEKPKNKDDEPDVSIFKIGKPLADETKAKDKKSGFFSWFYDEDETNPPKEQEGGDKDD